MSTTCSSQLSDQGQRGGTVDAPRRRRDGGEDGCGDEHRDDERRQPEPVVAEQSGRT
jgi:hypothetical protein